MAKTKNPMDSVFHRDGSVTFWNVYNQRWQRRDAHSIFASDDIMSSLENKERDRIRRIVEKSN